MKSQIDLLTVGAVSIVAYVIANVLHEAVGHGGACLLVGGEPSVLSTAYFDMVEGSVSPMGRRVVAASGTVVNLVAGGLFWLGLRSIRSSRSTLRYFVWLSMTINLLTGTGYFLFSGVSQIGDWIVVIKGAQPQWLFITMLIVVGMATYLLAVALALGTLHPMVGTLDSAGMKRAARLSPFAYAVGSLAASIGSLLNPVSPFFVFTSAAANFGGTSGLAWMTQLYKRRWFSRGDGNGIEIPRSWFWIVTAAVGLAVHVFVLGPSITF